MKFNLIKLTASSLLCCGMAAQAETAVNVQILSATIKDQKIANANLILQKNGEQSATGNTDAQGQASIKSTITDDNGALLIVKKEGYSDLVVKCPCSGMTYAISPVMKNLDGLRIVLNWGENPKDLDSHLVYPNNHIYFEQMQGTDALLDVDDTTGFGPETITIERKHDGARYLYAVHNFSEGNNPNSATLSASQAKVFVYVGRTLMKTYYVPENKVGNLWVVFAVTETGDLLDFNTIKGITSEKRLQTDEFQGIASNTASETIDYSADAKAKAEDINKQGEQAYHTKNYIEAIRLYKAAIDLDGNYGQAYSNLGLAFQKANNVCEALWANRKAIALASGEAAATVRANTHYNNGKIYEDAKQWDNALREYQYARRDKANPVYDKAIQRMQTQGAK